MKLPTVGALDAPTVTVTINQYWVGHIIGILDALTQAEYWDGDPQDIYENATQQAEALIIKFMLGD